MTRYYIPCLILLIGAFLGSCKITPRNGDPSNRSVTEGPTHQRVVAKMGSYMPQAYTNMVSKPEAGKVEMDQPEDVVKKLIAYAAAGNIDSIKAICDPASYDDSDAVFKVDEATMNRIAHARLSAEPINIQHKTAKIVIIYNYSDKTKPPQKETVQLALHGKKWYIVHLEPFK